MAGTAAVNSAVFRQFGAIEVDDLDQLLAVSQLLTRASAKSGNGLCIYTFSGGTAALAADLAGAARLPMAGLAPATQAALAALLPDFASIGNPVDTTADILRNPEVSAECLRILCADPSVGTVLYPIPMDYGAITDAMAEPIVSVASRTDTLIVPVWMSRRLSDGYSVMERAGLLPFLSLSDAIAALSRAIAWKGEPAPRRPAPARARSAKPTPGDAARRRPAHARRTNRAQRRRAAAHAAALGFPVVESGQRADPAQDRGRRRQAGHRLGRRGAPGPCRHPRGRGATAPTPASTACWSSACCRRAGARC